MKNTLMSLLAAFVCVSAMAQEDSLQAKIDSIEHQFTYQHGNIPLKGGLGTITVPPGFKYLDSAQARRVLVDLWGNPPSDNISMGLILPEGNGVLDDSGYVFNIQYDEIGFVKDDDAGDIKYDDLLKQMKEDVEKENAERKKAGFDTAALVGWASPPFYDKDRKILHWAKEIKFGDADGNTLNYNIRVLGRKGVLVLNAISGIGNLNLVKQDLPKVLDIVHFNEGYAYKDFDPGIDEVAAWTIGGLVAGKVLAKVGLFAVILKFWKLIALAVAGAFGGGWKKMKAFFTRKKVEEEPPVEPGAGETVA